MRKFTFTQYIREDAKDIQVNSVDIVAKNYDAAIKELNKIKLPFHHFGLVTSIKL